MQKQFTSLRVALVVIVMLLAVVPRVNYSLTVPVWNSPSQLADGIPMPPPNPPKTGFSSSVIIVDGIPMPPPNSPKNGYIS